MIKILLLVVWWCCFGEGTSEPLARWLVLPMWLPVKFPPCPDWYLDDNELWDVCNDDFDRRSNVKIWKRNM